MNSNAPGTASSHTITINSQEFFEVCVDSNMDAIEHHEIDISNVKSDAELFQKIWDSYFLSRGNGIRGLLLQPSDVQFVKVGFQYKENAITLEILSMFSLR
jgi:hypothetical protein